MQNLSELIKGVGIPALLVVKQGRVSHITAAAARLLPQLKIGVELPRELDSGGLMPAQVTINGKTLTVVGDSWGEFTLLQLTEEGSVFGDAAAILNSIDEGIHVVNERGQTVFYNPTMAKLEGMDYNQVINKDVLAIFPSLTPETSTILRVLRTREPIYDQVQTYFNHKGRRITTVNSTIPLWDKDKTRFIGVLEVAKDVTRMEDLTKKVVDLQQQLYRRQQGEKGQARGYTFADIIGTSPALWQPLELARRAARTASPVLIYGETGTGKELVAQSIHQASGRSGPFIAQNCAALPESLLEGILFGTAKGSFTGAMDRPGLMEQADGGTLLLDEINSMGIDLQAKLLRVLQDSRVRRVGGLKEIAVDLRVIATTNAQPQAAVSRGILRQDLYYRLAVVNINLPPLRQRREDIPILCQHFTEKYNRRFNLEVQSVTPEVLEIFKAYHWPGNVRELEHVIEGVMNLLGDEIYIELHHLPQHLLPQRQGELDALGNLEEYTLPEAIALLEERLVRTAMNRAGGNITQAAQLLGITRQVLQYKLKQKK
jgi:arginine utilization regulatory protein